MNMPYQTVLISGAGSGFGREMARCFAKAGWRVGVTDIVGERAEETLAMIGGEAAGHFAQTQDIQDVEQWQALTQRVQTEWGGLGVLINNAGVAAGGALEDTPLADWQWIIDIDLMGVVKGCHAFIPLMRKQKGGHIVNISSFAGLAGAPQIAAYGCAKAAVVGLSELIRAELHADGVGVSVVCPSFVKTNLLETFRSPVEGHKGLVQKWMDRANVNAEDIARDVYEAVQRRRFMVLTHRETKWMWRLKRWFPELYFKFLLRSVRGKRK